MRVNQHGLFRNLIPVILTMAAVTAVLIPVFLEGKPWPAHARDYLEQNGQADSGALNLVSAIYLGYRAFDTLGETIVLLVAVSGTIAMRAYAGSKKEEKTYEDNPPALRTNLIEVVTGKLAPVVLLFGFYVMLYGHLSPGGGFQGGVVIASGIVFLEMGTPADAFSRLTQTVTLARIEAAAFLLLVLVSLSGIVTETGFFSDPIAGLKDVPAAFIIILNTIIGLKVGAGMGVMCIALLQRVDE